MPFNLQSYVVLWWDKFNKRRDWSVYYYTSSNFVYLHQVSCYSCSVWVNLSSNINPTLPQSLLWNSSISALSFLRVSQPQLSSILQVRIDHFYMVLYIFYIVSIHFKMQYFKVILKMWHFSLRQEVFFAVPTHRGTCKLNFYLVFSRKFFIATLCFPQELKTNELCQIGQHCV